MYPKNTWYVACTPDEIVDKPLARKICGQNVVFYRDGSDKVIGLEDFCPHRGAPLSLGYLENGKLVCGYHGLTMGSDGKTDSMPLQNVKSFPCIKAYPVAERNGFVWIWPGEKSLAKEEDIPNYEWGDSSDWGYGGGLYNIACDYRLMVDNLMDLTHETYVHSTSIGQKEIEEEPVTTKIENGVVITSRFMENIIAPPFWKMALQECGLAEDVPVDRWQICRFTPPSHVMIEVGVAHVGHGGYHAEDRYKASTTVVDFITPETDTSIWYFWGMARKWRPQDESLTAKIREGQGAIFAEDQEMLERQQANLSAYPDRRLIKLDIDSGGVHARHMITKMIKQERALRSVEEPSLE